MVNTLTPLFPRVIYYGITRTKGYFSTVTQSPLLDGPGPSSDVCRLGPRTEPNTRVPSSCFLGIDHVMLAGDSFWLQLLCYVVSVCQVVALLVIMPYRIVKL